ncbi:hypothetical protein CHH49_00625 [Terribacillus saccharophilus]|uniref:SMI1/KNR4 family protein n=1 Tax=Terribacillus saccharophilus TaxID=361277 RepID=UPI000BA7CD3B|nr:SMI1/KNR4 family protein [Terribacillus saccharophilus]PAF23099.1 hypothetical protein CHH49_00625 [Terribacillus saccharophilus]
MSFELVKNNKENKFHPVSREEIEEIERDLNLILPIELRIFYLEVGYGFVNGSEFNINRIMDPYSIRDFRQRVNDFEFYPDIEIYDEFEDQKLIFFEANESALLSIDLGKNNENPIYYYDTKIADSLKDFLKKIEEDDTYYYELLEE